MADRWLEIRGTSESGRAMFVCQSCGRKTDAPSEECPSKTMYSTGNGATVFIPCSVWPMRPTEWEKIERRKSPDHIVFSGTITYEDGTTVEVTAPIHEALAKDLVVIDMELKMRVSREAEALKEIEESENAKENLRMQNELERLRAAKGLNATAKQSTRQRILDQSNALNADALQRSLQKQQELQERLVRQQQHGGLAAAANGNPLIGVAAEAMAPGDTLGIDPATGRVTRALGGGISGAGQDASAYGQSLPFGGVPQAPQPTPPQDLSEAKKKELSFTEQLAKGLGRG